MSSFKNGISFFAIASIMLVSACASTQAKQSLGSGASGKSTTLAIPPPENAEQLAERLLALLAHARAPQDLSPSVIQRYMGVHMQPEAGDASQFEASGRLAGDWTYALTTVHSSYDVAPHALRLRFDDGRDGTSDISAVCKFDYIQYKSSLEQSGFEPRIILGSQRQVDFSHESGSGIHVTVYVRGESAGNPQKKCVDMVLIDFMPNSHKTPHAR